MAKEHLPDLVISDIVMPEMDGYALCRELKEAAETDHIALVLLSAKASHESIIKGLENHANDYITKPFLQSGLNVSEVAYQVGFRSISYFSNSFKEFYGVVPSAYAHS